MGQWGENDAGGAAAASSQKPAARSQKPSARPSGTCRLARAAGDLREAGSGKLTADRQTLVTASTIGIFLLNKKE
jgi:hypothetical protein